MYLTKSLSEKAECFISLINSDTCVHFQAQPVKRRLMNALENPVSTMVPAMISLMDTTAHAQTGIQVISYFYQARIFTSLQDINHNHKSSFE